MLSLNPPIRDWSVRTVWIVGASSGIGLALAGELIGLGARVIVSARRAEALHTISPSPFMSLPCDVSKPDDIEAALTRMCDAGVMPDVVIWLAGVYHPMASDALQMDQVSETLDINLMAAYRGQAALVRWWQNTAGPVRHWVLVSSVAGYSGLPQAAAYGASKAAMTYLAETAYLELRRLGIAVSVVNPGFVDTRLTRRNQFRMPGLMTPQAAARATLRGLSQGRFEVHYPWHFTIWLKFLRILPYAIYLRLMRSAVPREDESRQQTKDGAG